MLCPNCAYECRDDAAMCPNCSFPLSEVMGTASAEASVDSIEAPIAFEPETAQQPLTVNTAADTAAAGSYESVGVQPLDPYALSVPEQGMYGEQYDPYYQAQDNVRQPQSYKTGIALCLVAAAILVIGAVVLLMLSTSGTQPQEQRTVQEEEPAGVAALHGAWANDDSVIVFTYDGRFAATGDKGTYELSGTDIMLRGAEEYSVGSYSVDGDRLEVVIRDFGTENRFVYYHVSDETNLSTSQLRKLWEKYRAEHDV